jgi:hypothetical protein
MVSTGDYRGRVLQVFWALTVNLLLLCSCAALHQTRTEVFTREPGHRLLEGPKPADVEVQKDWQFASMSEAAYRRVQSLKDITACEDPNSVLAHAGWTRWHNFPDDGLAHQIKQSNLRVEVWGRKEPPSVTVAFGGTIFSSGKDWRSNFRWFIPFHVDEYTDVVKVFGPAFVAEFVRRAKEPEWAYLENATIYATGHSLGGGLAQQFAYALPADPSVPRVTQVYAFDPSPVTGFYSIDSRTRNINIRGLKIDRIYERGEILATVRFLTSILFYAPSAINPGIRAVRYSLFDSNPMSGHSMAQLACELQTAAQ